jgi:hypothetical protein
VPDVPGAGILAPSNLPKPGAKMPAITQPYNFEVEGFTGAGAASKAIEKLGLNNYQKEVLQNYTIYIDGNAKLAHEVIAIVEAYKFTGKQIPISANPAAWEVTKGTVAGYAFEPKVVKIVPHGDAVYDWVDAWNRKSIQTKTARIVVSTSKGGGKNTGGGIPMDSAAGGFYDKATVLRVGEAGPEAIVPLDRDLSRVDPAVRAMSGVLQQMTGGRGATGNGSIGPKVNFEAGAFNVNLPTGDPSLAAEAVLDRLVAYIR